MFLHAAAHNWNEAGLQALLELGADPDALDEHRRQPLHWAAIGRCLRDYEHGTKRLAPNRSALQAESVVNTNFQSRLAALESTISHFLAGRHITNIDRQDAFGHTPLHYAASMKLVGAAALLVEKGADPSLTDNEGRTALHHLASPLLPTFLSKLARTGVEDTRLVAALTEQSNRVNACINRADNTGSTALHIAARSAVDEAVALLLRLGADPNLPDPEGSTPLHLAAQRPDWVYLHTYDESEYGDWARRAARIKALLLGAGADASVRNAQGRTAAEIENAGKEELRAGRGKYLEWLATPPPPRVYGRGHGAGRGAEFRLGFGRAAPWEGEGEQPAATGAGHGRGG